MPTGSDHHATVTLKPTRESWNRMEDIDHLEPTPSLLKFYRSRIHELQRDQNASILNRLKLVELSAQDRKELEYEVFEYEDELEQKQQDLDDLYNALIRERRAVIELVEENVQLRGTSFLGKILMRERYGEVSLDSVPESDQLSSLKRQYETLLNSILTNHKSYLSRIRFERESTATKMEDLIARCERLETAVTEGTKELLKERGDKQSLQIRVEEMQTHIEQRILELRNRLNNSRRIPTNSNSEINRLKEQNARLQTSVDEFKNRLAAQSSAAQDRISSLELELYRRKQLDYEFSLQSNPTFHDKIKEIERLALRYAPLQGAEVDHLFSEIQYAKDVIDGKLPPPKRTKSKRKKIPKT